MKTYNITLKQNNKDYLPNKYFLKMIRKKWRELGGTTCNKNINHVIGDEYTIIQFNLIYGNNIYNITFTEI
jgi:hypothetical protein